MKRGTIHIYSGDGRGKSPAALGRAIQMACQGENVVIIQFLKGKGLEDSEFLKRLEPEIKLFRFEKSADNFMELTEEQKKDETGNIKNGLNYAKKVLTTGECALLILDEVLGLIDNNIITVEDLRNLLEARTNEETDIIMTGITLNNDVCVMADEVTRMETVKFKVW